jgi:PRC-barrel domain/Domain of unknown function (DUF2382)
MPRPDIDTALGWRGRTVLDRDGERLGKLGAVYLDEEGRPAFGGVRTGLFGHRESVVPLHEAAAEGDDLRVPYGADEVSSAPNVDPEVELSREEEAELLAHFGEGDAGTDARRATGGAVSAGQAADATDTSSAPERGEGLQEGEGMVRSEEEVDVSAGPMRPSERVRLRKVLVTEHVEKTVPVRREEIRLETEPPPEGHVESVEDVDRSD